MFFVILGMLLGAFMSVLLPVYISWQLVTGIFVIILSEIYLWEGKNKHGRDSRYAGFSIISLAKDGYFLGAIVILIPKTLW